MLCHIKGAFLFFAFDCSFLRSLVQQHFAVLFAEHQVVMLVLCDGMHGILAVCCSTFNVELAALQHLHMHKAFRNELFRLFHMLRLDACANFHSIAGLAQQHPQYARQLNAVSPCIGNLYAVRIFKNIGADKHFQLLCGRIQMLTGSGNRQCQCNRLGTAHAGLHFCFNRIDY